MAFRVCACRDAREFPLFLLRQKGQTGIVTRPAAKTAMAELAAHFSANDQGTVRFDSHVAFLELKKGGLTDEAASAVARAQTSLLEYNLATKNDIAGLRLQMETMIANAKLSMIKWLLGMSFTIVAVLVAILKLLPGGVLA